MLSTKDVQKLIDAMKGVFYTKEDLDERFDFIGEKFEVIDQKFEAIDHRFEGIDQRFEGVNQKLSNLQTSVDLIALDNKNINQNLTVLNHRVEKLETWTKKVEPKIGIKF